MAVALERGRKTIWYDSNAVEIAFANKERFDIKRRIADAEFREELANSTFVGDAILSFYIGHINAPLSLANDAVSLAWKGTEFVGLADDSPPQLPKIPYVGEYGKKHGESVFETGAKMGLLAVLSGPLGPAILNFTSRASAMAGSIGYGSAQVGTFAVQAARLAMFTGAIVDIGELSAAVTALLYTASTESGEARTQAVESLKELAVYGAMEWLATRKTSKKKNQRDEASDKSGTRSKRKEAETEQDVGPRGEGTDNSIEPNTQTRVNDRAPSTKDVRSGNRDGILGTAAKPGLERSPETIAVGTVRMEDHPKYQAAIHEIESQGFTVIFQSGHPFVKIIEYVDPDGTPQETQKYVSLTPGMRFLDLEHELGHVDQLTKRFGDHPPPTDRIARKSDGRESPHGNQSGIVNVRQGISLEYHNRLIEFVRLEKRGAQPDLLRDHAKGVAEWRQKRSEKTRRSKSHPQWESKHLGDLSDLEAQYKNAGGQELEKR